MSAAVGGVTQQEALDNLAAFAGNPYSLPSEMYVSAGTAQVTNSVTPSITFPLSSTFTSVLNGSRTTTTAGGGASLGASVVWQLGYNLSPIVDATTLRNLSIIYRAVVTGPTGVGDVIYNFQPPQAFGPGNTLYPDPYYLQYSNCVFCVHFPADTKDLFNSRGKLKNPAGPFDETGLVDNDKVRTYFKTVAKCANDDPSKCKPDIFLQKGLSATINDVFTHQWLFYYNPAKGGNKGKIPAGATLQHVGYSGGYTFWVVDEVDGIPGTKLLSDFVLLTLAPAPAPDRSKSDLALPKTTQPGSQKSGQQEFELHIPALGNSSEGQKARITEPSLLLPPLLPP